MREQILAMKPGRELDALVAEKVMGWTGVGPDVDAEIYGWPSGHNKELGVYWVPHYSTDISAAWEVVEKMRHTVTHITINNATENSMGVMGGYANIGDWHCNFRDEESHSAYAPTAPEAICKAALLVAIAE